MLPLLARASSLSWLLLPVCAQQAAHAPPATGDSTRIVLHESAAIDLYFHVRAMAGGSASPGEAFAPAVEAARELYGALGRNALALGAIEGLLPGCRTAADVATAFGRAPETVELRGGAKAPLRAGAAKLAQALVAAEPHFEALWKEHARIIADGRARWNERVGAREAELLAFHLASLGMRDPGLAIPVYLMAEAPWPGAVTHLDEEGRGVCFVAVKGEEGSQLLETVLHEVTHALDVASDEWVLNDLRGALAAAGIGRRDAAFRDLPHTLMFVQAAESIRRIVAPEHRDYGDVSGYYGRAPESELVRGFWRDHLEGKLSRAEAIAGIVAGHEPAPR